MIKKTLLLIIILCLSIPLVSATQVTIYEEGWNTAYILPDDNTLSIKIYYDENNISEIIGADILIFNFIPSLVNDIYVTTDIYTYMCDISFDYGLLFNNVTFHIQYSDVYGNSYDNYTIQKGFFLNNNILTYELGIDRTGLYIEKGISLPLKKYIYTYEYPIDMGWLNANITSNIDYNYESFTVSYLVVHIDDYDEESYAFNKIKDIVDTYIPFGSEFIALLSAFASVLKGAMYILVRIIKYPLYIAMMAEVLIMGHALVQHSFMEILKTFVHDNYLLVSAIIGFFKNLIMFLIDLIKMVKPF